jgi:cellulose synthase/poly-beta-1,6-N-acetylglucosamine synthase-like glycosyltransferase
MISIIITSFKEPQTIGRAIEHILANKIKGKYEILVTAPDEETLNAARIYAKKNRNIKVIKDNGQGKPAALNLVFSKAKGDILVLTDGDVYIDKNAISNLLLSFSDKQVGAVSGRPISLNSKSDMIGYWSQTLFDMAHSLRKKRSKQNQFLLCSGYLFALRKGIVKQMPLDILDDAYISQEVWMKNYKIKYSENAFVYVKNPTTFKDWIKQKKRNMYGEFELKKYNIPSMRSFKDELKYGLFGIFRYPKSIKELFWTITLFSARLYVWMLAFILVKFKKKELRKVWQRVESTK